MIKEEEVYRIGKLGKPHGVRGEVSFMFNDDVFDRVDAEYLVLRIDGILVPFYIEDCRFRSGGTALVKFCGTDTQEQARRLTNCEVFFPRRLSDSGESGMTMAEISGFTLTDVRGGKTIGRIASVDDSTANILFEVDSPDGRRLLIPAAGEFIKEIDSEKKQIKVELPDGLLDLENTI